MLASWFIEKLRVQGGESFSPSDVFAISYDLDFASLSRFLVEFNHERENLPILLSGIFPVEFFLRFFMKNPRLQQFIQWKLPNCLH